MEIQITPTVANAVCNSLRASKQSLQLQLKQAQTKPAQNFLEERKVEIIKHQLKEVEETLLVFQELEV